MLRPPIDNQGHDYPGEEYDSSSESDEIDVTHRAATPDLFCSEASNSSKRKSEIGTIIKEKKARKIVESMPAESPVKKLGETVLTAVRASRKRKKK